MVTPKMIRLLGVLLLIYSVTGFRLLPGKWAIGKGEPTIWVNPCAADREFTFGGEDVDDGDELKGTGDLSMENVLQSIFNDYNRIATSYLRLALYPDDPNSPPTPLPGDLPFTIEKSKGRVIDICSDGGGDFSGIATGHAELDWEGDDTRVIEGCKVYMAPSSKDSMKLWINVATHEFGHCLGLAHPQETEESIMSYFRVHGFARLSIDDKMGISYLYPMDRPHGREHPTFGFFCTPSN